MEGDIGMNHIMMGVRKVAFHIMKGRVLMEGDIDINHIMMGVRKVAFHIMKGRVLMEGDIGLSSSLFVCWSRRKIYL